MMEFLNRSFSFSLEGTPAVVAMLFIAITSAVGTADLIVWAVLGVKRLLTA